MQVCYACNGKGKISPLGFISQNCSNCQGSGFNTNPLKIPYVKPVVPNHYDNGKVIPCRSKIVAENKIRAIRMQKITKRKLRQRVNKSVEQDVVISNNEQI